MGIPSPLGIKNINPLVKNLVSWMVITAQNDEAESGAKTEYLPCQSGSPIVLCSPFLRSQLLVPCHMSCKVFKWPPFSTNVPQVLAITSAAGSAISSYLDMITPHAPPSTRMPIKYCAERPN